MKTKINGRGHEKLPSGPEPSGTLYWILAVGVALLSIRLFLWLLANAGVIAEKDINVMLVIAAPIALLIIGRMAPDRIRRD
ncbi:hypothetical protein WBP06_20920 [Novosphingobium sp. BL-8H]|uniref:hypothetical protein n=1 Tax=Novosphingobium sp. BL-8H TaxID=3127640 RepID=UPI003756B06B